MLLKLDSNDFPVIHQIVVMKTKKSLPTSVKVGIGGGHYVRGEGLQMFLAYVDHAAGNQLTESKVSIRRYSPGVIKIQRGGHVQLFSSIPDMS